MCNFLCQFDEKLFSKTINSELPIMYNLLDNIFVGLGIYELLCFFFSSTYYNDFFEITDYNDMNSFLRGMILI